MYFILICFSVIIIIPDVSSEWDNIKDLSDSCTNGRVIYTYLTTGIGKTDVSVEMIANDAKLNCSIKYFVSANNYIMAVVGFPDRRPGKKVCSLTENSVVMVSDKEAIEACECADRHSKHSCRLLGRDMLTVVINSDKDMNTVKITATAMRNSSDSLCDDKKETPCVYKYETYCMTSECVCDGLPNCGLFGLYDENEKYCEGSTLTFKVIIFSLAMTILSFWLVVSIAMVLLPKRKETFVYKFDQTMPLFDSEGDQGNTELSIQIVFPDERSPNASTFSEVDKSNDFTKKSSQSFAKKSKKRL